MDFLARKKKRTTALQSPGRAAREMGGSREASRTAVAGNHCKRRAPRGGALQECRRQTQESARTLEGHNAEPAGRARRLETAGVQRSSPPLMKCPEAVSRGEQLSIARVFSAICAYLE